MASTTGMRVAAPVAVTSRSPVKLASQNVAVFSGTANVSTLGRNFVERLSATRASRTSRLAAKAAATIAAPAADDVEQAVVRTPWWLKDPAPNMKEVHNVQELVDALAAAGDKLVVLDFYAPWCGACKALYPKLRRICEEHDDIVMLKINLEESKQLCKTMGIKVLPFFHVYRGSLGRLAAFSASVAKIQRLRDAIAEHNTPRCFIGQTPTLPEFPEVRPVDAAECLSAFAKAAAESTQDLTSPSTSGSTLDTVPGSLEYPMQAGDDGVVPDLAAASFALPSSIAAAAALPTQLDIPQQRLSPSHLHRSAEPQLAAV